MKNIKKGHAEGRMTGGRKSHGERKEDVRKEGEKDREGDANVRRA